MNNTQRKFLIDKIQKQVNLRIDALRYKESNCPSLNNWILHAVLSNNFELKSISEIKETLRQKALKANDRDDWLGNKWMSGNKENVVFTIDQIFVVPDEYAVKRKEYDEQLKADNEEIRNLSIQADTLITRIQLASDKTLQTMINEVDDMGNISLMDTKLKLLTNG